MAPSARLRVRVALTREIADAARVELAEVGAAALSLRAVARRVGMAPSALYRYYDGRDHLLTALITDAYDALAEAARLGDRSAATSTVAAPVPTAPAHGTAPADGADAYDRWVGVGRAVRRWAAEHPHEWALVFGSPVPGYAGTDATTAAATGLHSVAIGVLVDAHAAGRLVPRSGPDLDPAGIEAVRPAGAITGSLPLPIVAAGLDAWVHVLGHVSIERFGHLVGAVSDPDAYFDTVLALAAASAGLVPHRP